MASHRGPNFQASHSSYGKDVIKMNVGYLCGQNFSFIIQVLDLLQNIL